MLVPPPSPSPAAAPRKRDRTRDRLLRAAQEVILEHSTSALSIREIAQRAEVVTATFYNYYATLDEVVDAVALLALAAHGQILGELTRGLEDPADVVASSSRQSLLFVVRQPAYGKLVFDSGLPLHRYALLLRAGLHGDVVRGVEAGRFRTPDVDAAVSMIVGAMQGVAGDLHRGHLQEASIPRVAAHVLEMLGLPRREAETVAGRKVAFLEPPALPISWWEVESGSYLSAHIRRTRVADLDAEPAPVPTKRARRRS